MIEELKYWLHFIFLKMIYIKKVKFFIFLYEFPIYWSEWKYKNSKLIKRNSRFDYFWTVSSVLPPIMTFFIIFYGLPCDQLFLVALMLFFTIDYFQTPTMPTFISAIVRKLSLYRKHFGFFHFFYFWSQFIFSILIFLPHLSLYQRYCISNLSSPLMIFTTSFLSIF